LPPASSFTNVFAILTLDCPTTTAKHLLHAMLPSSLFPPSL
jgi:hypothetical protein